MYKNISGNEGFSKMLKTFTVITTLLVLLVIPMIPAYASHYSIRISYDEEEQANGNTTSVITYTISAEYAKKGVGGSISGTEILKGEKYYYVGYAAIASYYEYYGYNSLEGAGFGSVGKFGEGSAYTPCSLRGYKLKAKTFPYGYPVIKYWDDDSKSYIEFDGKVLRYTITEDKVLCPDGQITIDLHVQGQASKGYYSYPSPHSIEPISVSATSVNSTINNP
jgi:hypothetical protein